MPGPLTRLADRVGRKAVSALDEMGFAAHLLGRSLYWLAVGHQRRQPVRMSSIVAQAMDIGIGALPILSVLAFTIGVLFGFATERSRFCTTGALSDTLLMGDWTRLRMWALASAGAPSARV